MNHRTNGPLRYCADNPRYFCDADGTAVYLTGSHTWATQQDMWLEGSEKHCFDYPHFIGMLEDYGHNFLRYWCFALHTKNAPWGPVSTLFDPMPYARLDGGAPANDGLPKFDLDRFNQDYFDRLRARVQYAAQRGVYVSIMLFEGWSLKWSTPEQDAWTHHCYNPQNNVNGTEEPEYLACPSPGTHAGFFTNAYPRIGEYQRAFVRKMVDTVNDLDNVLFEVCNEIPYAPACFEWMESMCRYIKEYEATLPNQHPVGVTAEGGDQDNDNLFCMGADWLSPSMGEGCAYRCNPPAATGEVVILNDTDHLWGHGAEVSWVWKSFTRGLNVLFMDPWDPITGDQKAYHDESGNMNARYYYKWDDVRRNLGYTRAVSQRFNMNRMLPDTACCSSGYALSDPGNAYICFFPAGGEEAINFHAGAVSGDGAYELEWIDPATGKTYRSERKEYKRRALFKPPFVGEAVLLLYK